MKNYHFRQLCFVLAVSVSVWICGCGGDPGKEPGAKPDKKTSRKGNNPGNKKPAKPVKVISKLPHRDIDLATANKGIDPGRILIDAKGKDSKGQSLALSDYKGKVILLDTWASW